MGYMESPESHISKSLNFLKRQKIMYRSGVNGGILNEHIMSLKHGFKFLARLLEFSQNQDLKQSIRYSVANMKHKLYLLTFDRQDGCLFINLEQAYVVLRREMRNIIIKSGTNEYHVIFPDNFTMGNHYFKVSSFLCQEIKKLVTSDYKADQITPMINKLEDIREMLTYFLEPMFENATEANWPLVVSEEGTQIFTLITDLLDRATCLIYMCFVGKMDDEMVFSLKSSLSDLVIQETQIMKVYLVLDIYYTRPFTYHISLSLRLLEWNKKCCSVSNLGGALEDHFMSIKHGLQFLDRIFKHSGNRNLQLNIEHLVTIVKQKLHSLLNNQKDEHWTVDLDNAYSDLREEMKNVVIVPGTDTNESLFTWLGFKGEIIDFILEKIMVLASSKCKVNEIIPMMEWEELRKMLTSLKYVRYSTDGKDRGFLERTHVLSFIGKAARLIYLTFIGKLNEEMLLSIREDLSYLIDRTDVEEMFHKGETLGHCKDNFESNIDISLSLLKIQETYHMGTINETMLKDHIMSLEYGLEFLKWCCQLSKNEDLEYGHKFHPSVMSRFTNLEQRIMLFAGNVKLKLESVAYKHEDETLNMDVNHAYADLREEMKNIIIMPGTNEYDTLIPVNLTWGYNFGGINDFLLEKTMTLVTSNCKSGEVAPLMKELEDLQKMLTSLRPLCLYIGKHWNKPEKILINFLTFYDNATCLIYLSFVGKMDIEMVLSVKIMKETDVWELYTTILNVVRSHYPERELYLLENLISLLELNIESLNDANSKLYEVLIDIRTFLLGLYPNMLFRKLHLLEPSFQAILGHSIPIVCSCYLEHTEVDISAALKCVLDQIKLIKSEVLKIKLYYFPRTDDLGFLEFFLGYLDDLMKNHEISMKEEVDALLSELHSLISLVTHKEINEDRWTGIINMAYEAEYIIDLHLVSSSSDLGLITSLSKIIQQLKNAVDVHGLHCKSLPAQDVVVPSKPQLLGTMTQVGDSDAIVGFKEEARSLMEYLLHGENKLDVISLVGMPGVGKTTLASFLYNTPSVAHQFDILVWCVVSQSYQNRDLLLAILDQVNPDSISDDQGLTDQLYRNLKKRRYLIVLDDIWDTTLWNYLKRYLPDDREGSRILITTRYKNVAYQIGSKVKELHLLTEEKSWELFQKKMLNKESLSEDLLKISKGIVVHCNGLPLSIVIIAGILSDIERTEKMWNQIAESVSLLVLQKGENCKTILELSYKHLPNHLRSCFLYLGSFPEDYEISVNHLMHLWVGEGLVRDTRSESAEEVAKKYMDDLILRSLVIPAKERSRGGIKTFRLHDLLRDFCIEKAKEEHFFMLFDKINYSRPLQDPRRLIINGSCIRDLHFSCHSIRSMICFDELKAFEIERRIGSYDMVLLKVLEVREVSQELFPNISNLVHLRYLALGFPYWGISDLPSSISKLHNLHVLILKYTFLEAKVIEVPDSIWDMLKLRHVHITPQVSFQVDSNRLQNSAFLLENLRSLSKVRVSCSDSKWLTKLTRLQRLCCVFVDDLKDNQFRMLSFNDHLTSLKVENEAGRMRSFIVPCQVPINLRELTLSGFFLGLNDILEIGALRQLEVFKIYSCSLPTGYEWNVGDGEFPRLKVLKLRGPCIAKWIASDDSFPSLEELWVDKCSLLDEIPLEFGYFVKLRLISVTKCKPSVDESARKIEKIQHEEQNTELKVRILPRNSSHHIRFIPKSASHTLKIKLGKYSATNKQTSKDGAKKAGD